MVDKIKKMKLIDVLHLLLIVLLYIPSKILKIVKPNIWIISENGDDAKDNGFAFFEYMQKHHPNIESYYIIEKSSSDYKKLKKYDNLLFHNSIRSLLYTMSCKYYISSQLASSFPYSNVFFNLYMLKIFGFKYIFLQHGITKEKVMCFSKQNSGMNMFCCAANPEYDFVKECFGYTDNEVVKTGFCRYDSLNSSTGKNNKSILFMPTWRRSLETPNDLITDDTKEMFINSKYYNNLQSLINNSKLIKYLEKNNITMYFCLHDKMRPYKELFETTSKNIVIVDKSYEKKVNDLIRECDYLITDTSSVAFDFAYQNKRIQYFHFDYDDIKKEHWEKGYFDYEKDGFGIVTHSVEEAVEEIICTINDDFANPQMYSERTNDFFCFRDNNNCKRTYEAIKNSNSNSSIETHIAFIISAFLLIAVGLLLNLPVLSLSSVCCLLINNLTYGFQDFKKNVYYILFNVSIFTFLISRPFIQSFRLTDWWSKFSVSSINYSFVALFLTLLFIFLGSLISNHIKVKENTKNLNMLNYIQKTSKYLFCITLVFTIITKVDMLLFMHGKSYTEYYLSYTSNLPSIIHLLSGMSTTFFLMFLITMPPKRDTFFLSVLYILPNIANFIIGQRNPIVLAGLFVFSYIIFRDYINDKNNTKLWVSAREKLIIIIMIPILIIGLDFHNYYRSNEEINVSGLDTVFDFFYTQGVSYDVLNIGYLNMGTIRSMNKNYVFGPIIDYFQENTIAKKMFKLSGLGIGNNKKRALEGNSFIHILGYLSRKDYLEGHGYGSSYLLELYCNYGYIGICFFSLLIGIFLSLIPLLLQKQNFLSLIVLYSTVSIYFIPRAETLSFIMFIFTPHFWAAIMLIALFIIKKKRGFNEN